MSRPIPTSTLWGATRPMSPSARLASRTACEFDWASLTPVPSAKVRPFRVAEAKAHLECEVAQIVTDRNTNIVLGRIVHAHVDSSVWKNGRVDPKLLDPVCRLSGSGYAALGDLVNVQRPQWRNIKGTVRMDTMPRAEQR